MKERPILFKGEMVRALLAGTKTQTRRVLSAYQQRFFRAAASVGEISDFLDTGTLEENDPSYINDHCPYGQPGDRLWVKETHLNNALDGYPPVWFYRADSDEKPSDRHWKPSIFCTRAASRITLEITDVRVERLNAISDADAKAEGVDGVFYHDGKGGAVPHTEGAFRKAYFRLWDKINGPLSHMENPWVWVIAFKRV